MTKKWASKGKGKDVKRFQIEEYHNYRYGKSSTAVKKLCLTDKNKAESDIKAMLAQFEADRGNIQKQEKLAKAILSATNKSKQYDENVSRMYRNVYDEMKNEINIHRVVETLKKETTPSYMTERVLSWHDAFEWLGGDYGSPYGDADTMDYAVKQYVGYEAYKDMSRNARLASYLFWKLGSGPESAGGINFKEYEKEREKRPYTIEPSYHGDYRVPKQGKVVKDNSKVKVGDKVWVYIWKGTTSDPWKPGIVINKTNKTSSIRLLRQKGKDKIFPEKQNFTNRIFRTDSYTIEQERLRRVD